jgi:7,8-dihydropterin-6-yl-methyl-4-(beta-D-ribofuranosyl)aminobenzene 5'-phosphate synthase
MEVDRSGLRAIVISHGHVDHHGGLEGLAARTERRRLPLLIHPGAWRERKVAFPTGAELHLPHPAGPTWRPRAWVVEERGPTLLLDGQVLISGSALTARPATARQRGHPGPRHTGWSRSRTSTGSPLKLSAGRLRIA